MLVELDATQQTSIHHATHILNTLSADLAPAFAPLPAKTKIPSNKKYLWSETAAIMGAPVKSKKRRLEHDPYSGNAQSGKKAKADAREALLAVPPPSSARSVLGDIANLPISEAPLASSSGSYYRPRSHSGSDELPPLPVQPLSSTTTRKAVAIEFDLDTFDLGDKEALLGLGQTQPRPLCKKYNVDTARANADMDHHKLSWKPPQHFPIASYPLYTQYPYYYPMYPAVPHAN
ncbi:hypothetical protein R3P38DRAFT_3237382 [Favolaschia claudopus]|uniref:Uncharacterized protein n=1 Tax=Favolaschia claudopus TaxID=2862362 RepID=A0AAV9ZAT2_9AGAR